MSEITIKPLGERVLIKPLEAETITASGLIIPGSAQEKQSKGTVVAVGTKENGEDLSVQLGDQVLFPMHIGTEIAHNGDTLLIISESDILAKL